MTSPWPQAESSIPSVDRQHVYSLYPCRNSGYHDYAVGPHHAVCNRCGDVVDLESTDQP